MGSGVGCRLRPTWFMAWSPDRRFLWPKGPGVFPAQAMFGDPEAPQSRTAEYSSPHSAPILTGPAALDVHMLHPC